MILVILLKFKNIICTNGYLQLLQHCYIAYSLQTVTFSNVIFFDKNVYYYINIIYYILNIYIIYIYI